MPEIKTCRTCVYMNSCPIYKVARETQIQNVQPEMFGCMWHRAVGECVVSVKQYVETVDASKALREAIVGCGSDIIIDVPKGLCNA